MENRFIYRLGSTTNIIGRPPNFYDSNNLISAGNRFCSVYCVREEDARAIEQEGTAANFRGIVWSQRLWIDFDNREAGEEARRFLKENNYDHVTYDTGGRGVHIGILRLCSPSHLLPSRDKEWVKENIKGADLSLYWHLHLIRLPGTVHERTGRKKELLEVHSTGRSIILPQYKGDSSLSTLIPNSKTEGSRPPLFTLWSVVSNLQGIRQEGSRHSQLVSLAIALKKDANLDGDKALWILNEVNRGFDEPKPIQELENIFKWAYYENK